MSTLFIIILSTFLISITSFIAAIFLVLKEEKLKKIILDGYQYPIKSVCDAG